MLAIRKATQSSDKRIRNDPLSRRPIRKLSFMLEFDT
jgi:hypothetical protein